MNNWFRIDLRPHDVVLARDIAFRRSEGKEEYASTRRWCSGGNYHYHGVLGEMAYSKHYGVPLDTSVDAMGDCGTDLVILGRTVDVKTANYNPPILKVNSLRDIRSDLVALAYREDDRKIWLCGFSNRDTWMSHFYTEDFGHGKRVCLKHTHLFF